MDVGHHCLRQVRGRLGRPCRGVTGQLSEGAAVSPRLHTPHCPSGRGTRQHCSSCTVTSRCKHSKQLSGSLVQTQSAFPHFLPFRFIFSWRPSGLLATSLQRGPPPSLTGPHSAGPRCWQVSIYFPGTWLSPHANQLMETDAQERGRSQPHRSSLHSNTFSNFSACFTPDQLVIRCVNILDWKVERCCRRACKQRGRRGNEGRRSCRQVWPPAQPACRRCTRDFLYLITQLNSVAESPGFRV